MNISRFLAGALLLCALPALAQPEQKPVNGLQFPLVSPEEATKLALPQKPIILHLRDVTLGDALDELKKQSGVSFEIWGGVGGKLGKKLSLDLEARFFSEAFEAIVDEADVKATLRQFGGWKVWFAQPEEEIDAPRSGVGPFQIRLISLSSSVLSTVTLGKTIGGTRSQGKSLGAVFGVSPDPQVAIIDTPLVRITRAEDEKGRSLRDETPDPFPFPFGGEPREQVNVPLRATQSASQKLAHLEGVAVYALCTKHEQWEVNDVLNAKGVSHEFESNGQTVTLSVLSAQQIKDFVTLNLQISAPNNGNWGWKGNPLFASEKLLSSLRLLNANGQKLLVRSYSGPGGNGAMLQIYFGLPQNGQPAPIEALAVAEPLKLVFDIPTEFAQTEVPFSFSDVPLP